MATGHALTVNRPNDRSPPTKFVTDAGVNVMGNRLGLRKVPAVEKLMFPAVARQGMKSAIAASRTILLAISVSPHLGGNTLKHTDIHT